MKKKSDLNNCIERLCRLCAEEQTDDHKLWIGGQNKLHAIIKTLFDYLGYEFTDDATQPSALCNSCHTQAKAIDAFLSVIKMGQLKLAKTRSKSATLAEVLKKEDDSNNKVNLLNIDDSSIEEEKYDQEVYLPSLTTSNVPKSKKLINNTKTLNKKDSTRRKRRVFGRKVQTANYVTNKDLQQMPVIPDKRIRRKPKRYLDEIEIKTTQHANSNRTIITAANVPDCSSLIMSQPIAELRSDTGKALGELLEADDDQSKAYFVCEFCKEVFHKQYEFLKHIRTHTNCSYECDECLQRFQFKCSFERHQRVSGHVGLGIIESMMTPAEQQEKVVKVNESASLPLRDEHEVTATAINITVGTNGQITAIDAEALKIEVEQSSDAADNVDGSKNGSSADSNFSIKLKNSKYACLRCQKTYDSPCAVRRHYKSVHVGYRPFKCSSCAASFKISLQDRDRKMLLKIVEAANKNDVKTKKTKYSHSIHQATHTGERRHICIFCQKGFITKHAWKAHLRTHTGEKPYKCPHCAKAFSNLCNMVEHKRVHTGERPHKCTVCEAAFKNASHLKSHNQLHLKATQKKLTKSSTSETQHKAAATTQPNTSSASNTSTQCRSLSLLNTQINKKASEAKSDVVITINTPAVDLHLAGNDKLRCHTCLKQFKQRCALTKHLRTHTGERPYKCPMCPKSFSDPSNFKKHKMLHTNATYALKTASAATREAATSSLHELRQMLEEQSVEVTQLSSQTQHSHYAASDPDPDGLETLQRLDTRTFTLSSLDSVFADAAAAVSVDLNKSNLSGLAWPSFDNALLPPTTLVDAVADAHSLVPFSDVASSSAAENQLVCISYEDPSNPIGKKTTTFYVVN